MGVVVEKNRGNFSAKLPGGQVVFSSDKKRLVKSVLTSLKGGY